MLNAANPIKRKNVMKIKKTKTAKNTFLKGHEPRTVHLEKLNKTFTTTGLTKKEWNSVKKHLVKMTSEDKKIARDLLSI